MVILTISADDGLFHYLRLTNGGSANTSYPSGIWYSPSGNMEIRAASGAATSNAAQLVLNSSGKVLIGTTNSAADANADDLTVGGASGTHGITIYSQNNSTGRIHFSGGTSGATQYAGQLKYDHNTDTMSISTGGTERMSITDNGYLVSAPTYGYASGQSANVYINSSGTFKRSTSALKYKTDVRDLESIDISSFRPIRYKSNVADDDPNEEFIGFIADEFHNAGLTELVSYSVSYTEDDIKKRKSYFMKLKVFNYDRLTAILTKSLQNSQTKITALETSVADLTTRLEALENA